MDIILTNNLIGSAALSSSGVPDDLLTTKGDTHGYSTTNARIPIGSDNDVLTADSTEALGLKWAAPAGGGSMSFVETFTLSGNSQFFDCELNSDFVYADFNSLILQGTLKASVTTANTVGCQMRVAPSGTTYDTADYFNLGIYNNNVGDFGKVYWSANPCVPLISDSTVGQGINDAMTVSVFIQFFDQTIASGSHSLCPYYYNCISPAFPLGQSGWAWHESAFASRDTTLSAFRFAFANDDFTFPAGTFEVFDGSTISVWSVKNT